MFLFHNFLINFFFLHSSGIFRLVKNFVCHISLKFWKIRWYYFSLSFCYYFFLFAASHVPIKRFIKNEGEKWKRVTEYYKSIWKCFLVDKIFCVQWQTFDINANRTLELTIQSIDLFNIFQFEQRQQKHANFFLNHIFIETKKFHFVVEYFPYLFIRKFIWKSKLKTIGKFFFLQTIQKFKLLLNLLRWYFYSV